VTPDTNVLLGVMRADQFIDIVQAAVLLTVAIMVIWAFNLLRKQLAQTIGELAGLFRTQQDMEERIERIWKRIDDIEMRGGMRGDVEEFSRIKRLLDALEEAAGVKKPPR
jgi:hypothetical protein